MLQGNVVITCSPVIFSLSIITNQNILQYCGILILVIEIIYFVLAHEGTYTYKLKCVKALYIHSRKEITIPEQYDY